jgi:antitoxin ParD1/3/4
MAGETTITVTLPTELIADLGEAVDAGVYASIDDAIRIGVETLEADKMIEKIGVERVRVMLQEGIDSGPSVDGEAVFERLIAKYGRMADERGE